MEEVIRCEGCTDYKRVICDEAFAHRAKARARWLVLHTPGSQDNQTKFQDPFEENLAAIDCALDDDQIEARLKAQIQQKTWLPNPDE